MESYMRHDLINPMMPALNFKQNMAMGAAEDIIGWIDDRLTEISYDWFGLEPVVGAYDYRFESYIPDNIFYPTSLEDIAEYEAEIEAIFGNSNTTWYDDTASLFENTFDGVTWNTNNSPGVDWSNYRSSIGFGLDQEQTITTTTKLASHTNYYDNGMYSIEVTASYSDGTSHTYTNTYEVAFLLSEYQTEMSSYTFANDSANTIDTISTVGAIIVGGGGNDSLTGNVGNDRLIGNHGDDSLLGGDGNDALYGQDGDDYLGGGNGIDVIVGGLGNDTMYGSDGADGIRGGLGNDLAYGGDANDVVIGNEGNDYLSGGNGNDTVYGNDGNDEIYGNGGADLVYGGGWADTIYGGGGNDEIWGGGGNDNVGGADGDDTLSGGSGNDTLNGGTGTDYLTGGTGADTFVFGYAFYKGFITDFDPTSGDVIDLTNASGITSYADLVSNHMIQNGADLKISDDSGNSFYIEDVLMSDLYANDFII